MAAKKPKKATKKDGTESKRGQFKRDIPTVRSTEDGPQVEPLKAKPVKSDGDLPYSELTDFGQQSRELEVEIQAVRDMPQRSVVDQCERWLRLAKWLPSLAKRAPDDQLLLSLPDYLEGFPNSPQLRDPARALGELLRSTTDELIHVAQDVDDRKKLVALANLLDVAMRKMPCLERVAINRVLNEAIEAVGHIRVESPSLFLNGNEESQLTAEGKQTRSVESEVKAVAAMPVSSTAERCQRWLRISKLVSGVVRQLNGRIAWKSVNHCDDTPSYRAEFVEMLREMTGQLARDANHDSDRRALVAFLGNIDSAREVSGASGFEASFTAATLAVQQVAAQDASDATTPERSDALPAPTVDQEFVLKRLAEDYPRAVKSADIPRPGWRDRLKAPRTLWTELDALERLGLVERGDRSGYWACTEQGHLRVFG